ncbi:isoleucine--tRNA ligase, partial [Candidatus Woesearchaeota archaeon]|nr:isoleucine--tRNA ligase [Candidatus Woesearchaeota archaeon]
MADIGNYDFKAVEEGILNFWKTNKIHELVNKKNKGGKQFYFLDGPPYTNGRIHLGHAWNKSMKDAVLRYKRMNGFDVWDRAGYDMHGMPTESATEKKLGIKGKEEIEKIGAEKFTEECSKLCVHYMNIMNDEFKRLGVWMDFENAYKSIDPEFIEGEWWLIKKAHENGRLYEGLRTITWCANDGTALAKHELEYKTVTDDSIYLKFPILGAKNEFLIVWTTTPWTIPYNLAVMANPDIDYVKAKVDDEVWILAEALTAFIPAVAEKKFEILERLKGEKLEGLKYKHPFYDEISFFKEIEKKSPKLHSVLLSSEYVDASGGSGLVHCAPGCGPEDYEVGHRNGLPPFNELDENGTFKKSMGKFAGLKAKVDDKKFIDELDKKGILIATTPVEHEYAHCWRCKNPVVYRTTKQWFFRVEDLKENMRELNKSIKWVPDYAGSRQFDSWLANLRDNSITRQRYWGTPVPIWKCSCGNYEVIGSRKELKLKTGKLPEDLHRSSVDKLTIKCKKCGNLMHRIPDVLDVWIDSGTTSWNCLHYPGNEKLFKKMFPPDFILEGIDQVRGWFNILFVSSMITMMKPAYKAVYMHGFVNDSEAQKMSKSTGNIISPEEVFKQFGADTLRYYLTGAANPGFDLNYSVDDMKVSHRNLGVLWNLHKFMIDYAKTIGKNPAAIKKPKLLMEEKYILSKHNSAVKKITKAFEEYRLNEVPHLVEDLFLELSRTYIQLVREKSSTGSDADKEAVLYTLYNVIVDILQLFSPICPFITEKMYLNIKEAFLLKEKSIHLFDWPSAKEKDISPVL